MKINQKSIVLIIGMLLVFSTTTFFVQANEPKKIEVIIGFQNDIDTNLIASYKGQIKSTMHQINSVVVSLPENAIYALQQNPKVRYIEEDNYLQFINAQTLPWGIDRIDAEKVWSSYTGDSVTIAIVDTGIDYDHPDLITNCLSGISFVTGVYSWMDDNGHGTHCAGIAAALNNNFGVVGVAPDASLLPVKVLNRRGSGYTSWVADGIMWAADNGADVISLSLGSPYYSQTLEYACNYAYYTKGCVVVAAAGNGGNSAGDTDCVEYPGRYDSVIAVGATTQSDSRAYFSATGPDLEVMGPGYNIYSTVWNNKYTTKSGTSMACPHVAGLAALIIESGTTDKVQVRNKLTSTAEDLGSPGFDYHYGYGLVDAEAAVGGSPPPIIHDVAITSITAPASVLLGTTVNIDVTVANEGTESETTTVILTDITSTNVIGSQSVTLNSGDSTVITFTWDTAGEAIGDHTLEATASIVAGETDTSDNSKTTTLNIYESPPIVHDVAITSITAPASVLLGTTVNIDVTVANEGTESETTTVILTDKYDNLEIESQSVSLNSGDLTTITFTWNTAGESLGDHTLEATASIVAGETDTSDNSKTTTVNLYEESAPKDMWVESIVWSDKTAGRNRFLYYTITVTSDDGVVTGALVDSTLNLEDGTLIDTFSGVTDSYGQIKFSLRKANPGNYITYITDLTHSTYTYNPSLNGVPTNPSSPAYTLT